MDDRRFFSRCSESSVTYSSSFCGIYNSKDFPLIFLSRPKLIYSLEKRGTVRETVLSKNTTQWRWLDHLIPGGRLPYKKNWLLVGNFGKKPPRLRFRVGLRCNKYLSPLRGANPKTTHSLLSLVILILSVLRAEIPNRFLTPNKRYGQPPGSERVR